MLKKAFIATLSLAVSVSACGKAGTWRDRPTEEPLEEFRALVQELATNPIEDRLFGLLAGTVLGALNMNPATPIEAAKAALARFKVASDGITGSWKSDKRLRYEILSVHPLLVLRLTIWNQDTFVTYAPTSRALNPPRSWEIVQTTDGDGDGHAPFEHLQIFPLSRGPSGNPRFLEVKHFSSCMAVMTLDYVVNGYEWHPDESFLTRILVKQSSFSYKRPKWKFDTWGKVIAIPYCWSGVLSFAEVDSPICSVDTYDLSGDVVRFLRAENDPEDLALVARVIEYAGNHDVEGLSALCISPQVARQLTEIMPPKLVFVGYDRKSLGPDSEMLDFQDDWEMKITLERHQGRWRVAAVKVE